MVTTLLISPLVAGFDALMALAYRRAPSLRRFVGALIAALGLKTGAQFSLAVVFPAVFPSLIPPSDRIEIQALLFVGGLAFSWASAGHLLEPWRRKDAP